MAMIKKIIVVNTATGTKALPERSMGSEEGFFFRASLTALAAIRWYMVKGIWVLLRRSGSESS